jgi:hypothetical protein
MAPRGSAKAYALMRSKQHLRASTPRSSNQKKRPN